ncbi:hypothetical protein M8J75_007607 [Diaphorina citri]|nr:hypothetical protein M8J75_007607 [Diaphorina citri]
MTFCPNFIKIRKPAQTNTVKKEKLHGSMVHKYKTDRLIESGLPYFAVVFKSCRSSGVRRDVGHRLFDKPEQSINR